MQHTRTEQTRSLLRTIGLASLVPVVSILLTVACVSAEEKTSMPLGAFECKSVDPVVEHARIVQQPTTAGLREFVEAQVASGTCRVVESEERVTVVDVDPRGFALVQTDGRSDTWWTDAENVWGYFDAPAKVKAWKKP